MRYGSIEVPNVRLVFLKNGTQVRIIDLETVVDYTEDFESNEENNGITIYSALIDTDEINFIESNQYSEILVYRSLVMRSEETGEDSLYFPPTLIFHKLNFEYSLATHSNPARWMIRLWN